MAIELVVDNSKAKVTVTRKGPITPVTVREAFQKRVRNMATNISISANTISSRAHELSDKEAQEVGRHLDRFHNDLLATEALIMSFTDGTPPNKPRAA